MACCGDASGWAKVGFICIFLAFGLQSAAFLTNYWMVYNTAKDLFDIRVGLLWYTNCTSACATSTTPSSYHSLFFTLTKIFEGVTIGLFFIIVVIYAFYVLADRSRTRATAISLIIILVTSVLFPIAGIVLWILQIDFPYFLAWSAGMSMIATGLAFFSMLCLIPDLKEYPYYNKMAIVPTDNFFDDMQYRKYDTKKNTYVDKDKIDREPKRKPHRKDPYSMKDTYMDDEIDRKALMVTPSRPPRYDFLKQNPFSTKY
ncbi:uncharacterized protein [Mytilus edulis]|uniref:uncharacterized protein n=1 Tax=Mytilus edulis TaxID=6550 RepID=UPI0039F09C2D